jgi:hypothetical protein
VLPVAVSVPVLYTVDTAVVAAPARPAAITGTIAAPLTTIAQTTAPAAHNLKNRRDRPAGKPEMLIACPPRTIKPRRQRRLLPWRRERARRP